jgi:hypothetical protein
VMDAMHLFNTRANTNKNKSAENEWTHHQSSSPGNTLFRK